MIYSEFKGLKISKLGYGTMRFPLNEDGTIDEIETEKLIDRAIRGGVNYFDTGYTYHNGQSEIVTGKILSKYPRDSFFYATKYPGHERLANYDPSIIFENQLRKTGLEYFDFYLLHNVCEDCLNIYEDERYGIIEYFKKQKELGIIKHLGFSTHAYPDTLEEFLSRHYQDLEFCQIQLNFLDWSLQDGKKKVEILNKYNIPIWIMEPNRGGRLSKLKETSINELKALRPNDSITSWSFNWLKNIESIKVILSGMSTIEQIDDNIKTFSYEEGLSKVEDDILLKIGEELKSSIPCTGCRYCVKGCPKGLEIPELIRLYNDTLMTNHNNSYPVTMYLETLAEDKWPSNCITCNACARICPQKINVPKVLKDFSDILKKNPRWADTCNKTYAKADKFNN